MISGLIGGAGKFRANSCYDFMEHDDDFDFTKDIVRDFVARVLSLMDTSPNGAPT